MFNNSIELIEILLFYINYSYYPRIDRDPKEGRLVVKEA